MHFSIPFYAVKRIKLNNNNHKINMVVVIKFYNACMIPFVFKAVKGLK